MPGDWDLWNASRTVNGANVIGPFDLPNVVVSNHVDLGGAVPAKINGHWFNRAFLLGSGPNGGSDDGEGIADRYFVGTGSLGVFGFAGDQSVDATWRLWLR
jgi:hypothetical protein